MRIINALNTIIMRKILIRALIIMAAIVAIPAASFAAQNPKPHPQPHPRPCMLQHPMCAPVLAPKYPDLLVWKWPHRRDPYKWNVFISLDKGKTFFMPSDYWMYGNARQFAPDGGSEPAYIVGVDKNGKEVTKHSNIVIPDDAPAP